MEIVKAVKKGKFNLARAIELSDTADCVYNLYRNPIQVSNFEGTFGQLFLWIFFATFTEDASLLFLYHGAKKSKMTKNSNQGDIKAMIHQVLHVFHMFETEQVQ